MASNFSETVLIEASYMLRPVKALNSAKSVADFFARLGYTLPQANSFTVLDSLVTDIDGIILGSKELIEAETDEARESALIALIPKIAAAFVDISNLIPAINGLTGFSTANNPPLDQLPKRLGDLLLFEYLYQRQPRLFGIFYLLGILDDQNGLLVVEWSRIPRYFTEPAVVFNEIYNWNTNFDTDLFLTRFQIFLKAMGIPGGIYLQSATVKNALGNSTSGLQELRIPVFQNGYYPELYAQFGLNISPAEAKTNAKKGIALIPYFIGTSQFNFEIHPKWLVTFSSALALDAGVGMVIRPPFNFEIFEKIFSAPLTAGSFELGLGLKQKPDQNNQDPEIFLFGSKAGSYLSIKGTALKFFVTSSTSGQDIGLDFDVQAITLRIGGGKGDSFLSKMLPEDGLGASVGFGLGYSLKKKFYFKGSSGIEIKLPAHIHLGPIEIQNITVGVNIENKVIPLSLGADVKGELGPLVAVIQNIGLRSELSFVDKGGTLGPMDVHLAFKFPDAIGLSLDTSAVKAGGFLSIKPDEYIGALELEIKSIKLAIKAIAIINTKLPGGQPGFSLLVIITAEFNPIQLSYGFTLNGVGGLFGYKRGFETDVLRLGLKNKTLDSILFPKNVIANITKIVTDLKSVFPIGNCFLIGPMVKIGWASLVTAEIGIIIQVPDPIVIAILGIVRIELPEPDNVVLKLQISFLATINFEKKLFTLDASLSESRVLVMTLTGDIALRIGWGSPAVFIFSSGGFHPDFREAPAELQHMQRLGIVIIDEKDIKLSAGTYFAVTTNTVQIGAGIRFWAQSGGYTALAEVGFDALIQFNPFFFIVSLYLTGRITGPMIDIVIDVRGNLSGPNKWRVWGHAHAKVVFFEITIPFDKTFGDPVQELAAELEDVFLLFKEEVTKNGNWKISSGSSGATKVSLRELPASPNQMILHPNSVLSFNQRLVPLDVSIQKFGNKKVDPSKNKFSIQSLNIVSGTTIQSTASLGNSLQDSYAPGNFFEIPKDQKLSRPSFEKLKSGLEFTIGTSPITSGSTVSKIIDYEVIYVRKKKTIKEGAISLLSSAQIVQLAGGGSAAKSKLSAENNRTSYQAPPQVGITPKKYVIANKTDLQNVDKSAKPKEYDSQAEAYATQSTMDENTSIIISNFES